jgi:hypothetical protein
MRLFTCFFILGAKILQDGRNPKYIEDYFAISEPQTAIAAPLPSFQICCASISRKLLLL